MLVLAADIGGTKTLFQLSLEQGDVIAELEFASQDFSSFYDMLAQFFERVLEQDTNINAACFAVAGPVSGTQASVTNLPWKIDVAVIKERFPIAQISLCNDFEAVGYGIDTLAQHDLHALQQGDMPQASNVRAVIGAGTGLGQAILMQTASRWQVMPTEGGHVDFAPTNAKQIMLFEHLRERFGHVSYERVLSGPGLVSIYNFLRSYLQKEENTDLRQAMIDGDAAAAISLFANEQNDELASEALALFFEIYGAQVGNLALACLPYAGIFIAGGIGGKNLDWFTSSKFLEAFAFKGKMNHLMHKFPIYVITQPQVGLQGARLLALQMLVE
jgi:glucokinase